MVQILAFDVLYIERDDSDPASRVRVTENLDIVVRAPAVYRPLRQLVFTCVDDIHTYAILDLKHEPGLERLQYARRTGLLALLDAIDEIFVLHTDIVDGATGTHARRQFAVVDALVEDEHAA